MRTSTCDTCGTQTLLDEETGAEVHFDVTYRNCGVEGELAPLVARIVGTDRDPVAGRAQIRRRGRHLRAVPTPEEQP